MSERLLGSLLLKSYLISQYQLEQALQEQRQQAESGHWILLGEILVTSGIITPEALAKILAEQAKLNEIEFFSNMHHLSTISLGKRIMDIVGALVGLVITSLLLPVLAIAIRLDSPGPILVTQPRMGLRGRQFQMWRLRTTIASTEPCHLHCGTQQGCRLYDCNYDPYVTRLGRLLRRFYLDEMPQFWNVLRGEMSLVGTRPPTLNEVTFYFRQDWQRLAVKPGMTGLWQSCRHKYYLSFNEVAKLDHFYISRWSHQFDLKILYRTFIHIFQGASPVPAMQPLPKKPNQVNILNVSIDNLTLIDLLERLDRGVVLTPNVDHLMKLQKDPEFHKIYSLADYKVCDSQVLMYASRFLGTPFKEKISGSDFFPSFYKFHRTNPDMTIFLLGGKPGVADRARTRINHKVGREIVIDSYSPSFGFEHNESECLEIIDRINQSQATVLAIGVGAPKQEKWIYAYKDRLPHVKIFLAVGATIDFEAGVVKRSPKWISRLGLEWLFRISCDPKRLWKRYLVDDLPFFILLLKQKLGLYTNPFLVQFERQFPPLLPSGKLPRKKLASFSRSNQPIK